MPIARPFEALPLAPSAILFLRTGVSTRDQNHEAQHDASGSRLGEYLLTTPLIR